MALSVKGMEGNELSNGDFTRIYVPQGRWSDTWDVLKSNFGKMFLINLFVLIFFIPLIIVVYLRSSYVSAMYSNYSLNYSVMYPFTPYSPGMDEYIVFTVDVAYYAIVAVTALIGSIGIAGGAYSVRKLLITREFTVKGFFHGVRVAFFRCLFPIVIFIIFWYSTIVLVDWRQYLAATGAPVAGATTGEVFLIIADCLEGMYCCWMLAVGASYKVGLGSMMRNSFVLLLDTPIQTIIMVAFAGLPVWIYLLGLVGSAWAVIAFIIFLIIGFSFALLCWMAFAQWGFDGVTDPEGQLERQAAAEEKRAKEIAEEEAKDPRIRSMQLLAAGRSELLSRPIMPIGTATERRDLGKTFTREDIDRAAGIRDVIKKDVAEYETAHKGDKEFKEYNALFAQREKALREEDIKNPTKKSKRKLDQKSLMSR